MRALIPVCHALGLSNGTQPFGGSRSAAARTRAPVPCRPRLALTLGTREVHQVELANPDVVPSVVALAALHHDAEDGVAPGRGQVHHGGTHRPVLLAGLFFYMKRWESAYK